MTFGNGTVNLVLLELWLCSEPSSMVEHRFVLPLQKQAYVKKSGAKVGVCFAHSRHGGGHLQS